MSVGACLGPDGALLPDTVVATPSLVAPARRLTYVDVDEIYAECSPEDEADLFDLRRVRRAALRDGLAGWLAARMLLACKPALWKPRA